MSVRSEGWKCYDLIVRGAASRDVNPWVQPVDSPHVTFQPDYTTLEKLLAVPVALGAASQSGVPALALDVWAAYEFRRPASNPTPSGPAKVFPGSCLANCCS